MSITWTLTLAHDVGRTSRRVSDALEVATGLATRALVAPVRNRIRRLAAARADRETGAAVDLLEPGYQGRELARALQEALARQAPEIAVLMEASGLAGALGRSFELVAERAGDPAFEHLRQALSRVSPSRREWLARRTVDRIERDQVVQRLLQHRGGTPPDPADLQRVASLLDATATEALRELGLDAAEARTVLAALADAQQPITELVALYANPHGLRQHLVRLWRLQRIAFAALRIAARRTAPGDLPSDYLARMSNPARNVTTANMSFR